MEIYLVDDPIEDKYKEIKQDISIIYVDGCCNKHTDNCAWGSVVNMDKIDLIPIYKDLSADLIYSNYLKNEIIVAKANDVSKQQNNYAELLSFLFALRMADKYIDVKEIKSDSDLVIKWWSNPEHKTDLSDKDKNKAKYILESKKLRKNFETRGGIITKISGKENLADLGFHKD